MRGVLQERLEQRMNLLQAVLNKLGFTRIRADRHPIRVFLLDDDERRHRWFASHFKGDVVDVAVNVAEAQQLLSASSYDAIFLDHDLHPEHYHAESTDDERTGYAIAAWLCRRIREDPTAGVAGVLESMPPAPRRVDTTARPSHRFQARSNGYRHLQQ